MDVVIKTLSAKDEGGKVTSIHVGAPVVSVAEAPPDGLGSTGSGSSTTGSTAAGAASSTEDMDRFKPLPASRLPTMEELLTALRSVRVCVLLGGAGAVAMEGTVAGLTMRKGHAALSESHVLTLLADSGEMSMVDVSVISKISILDDGVKAAYRWVSLSRIILHWQCE